MKLPRIARTWLDNRDLDRRLAKRRMAREARRDAALRGKSTEWKRRAAACREVFSGVQRIKV